MIRLEAVSRIYHTGGEPLCALDEVSLEIDRGEYVAIMGASGSGKSTMMNIIGILDPPTLGHYLFEGYDVGELTDDQRAFLRSREFGFVFQQFHLLPRMTALEQVELPLIYQKVARRREAAAEALAGVGLADRMHHQPTQLSGGQQQRVAIARALVAHPRVILADEPTGALDSRTGTDVMELLTALVREQGITVILVTHEENVAAYAERVIRMRDGRIVEDVRRDKRVAPVEAAAQ